jgi:outer membrane protein assembly factor BamB
MQLFDSTVGPIAVIAAPLLWPIAAILQLLFPVILRDRIKAYRWACAALATESGLLVLAWLLDRFWPGHLPAAGLTWSLIGVTTAAALAAWWQRPDPDARPHRMEWLAFAVLLAVFGGRALTSLVRGAWVWDLGNALALASAVAIFHLTLRRIAMNPTRLTTQRVFLAIWCLTSVVVAYHRQLPADLKDVPGEWPTFRFNAQRTGSLDPTDAGPMRPGVVWRFRCPGDARLYASPVVAGGEVIAVATQTDITGGRLVNRVYRLDAASGKQVGSIDLPQAGVSSPAVRGGLVVLGEGYHEDRDCSLRILDRRSGMEVGSYRTASHVESSPALDGNRVYFGAGEDGIFGIELTDDGTPRPLWHVRGDHIDAAPVVAGGTVCVGSGIGDAGQSPALLAINAANGDVRWRVPAPLSAIAGPSVDGARIFFALGNGKLNQNAERPAGAIWCLDRKTGDRLWQVSLPASIYASPVCSDDRVVCARGDGVVQCLRQGNGGEIWQTSVGRRIVAGPIFSGGAVFVVDESGLLVRLDAATGQIRWKFDDLQEAALAGDVRASPVLAGGRIIVAAGSYVFCVGDRED